MRNFQPYSDATNFDFIHSITRKIIRAIAPEEEKTAEALVDRIVEDYEDGIIINIDSKATSGGFGSVDLITLVVVPLVVEVLDEILKQLVVQNISELKNWVREDKSNSKRTAYLIDKIVEDQYVVVTQKVKSQRSLSNQIIIKRATKSKVADGLGLTFADHSGNSITDAPPLTKWRERQAGDPTTPIPLPADKKKKPKGK